MTKASYETSPLLEGAGFRHAFFTRLGGVSEGPYASLNFSVGVGDAPENVAENLRRAAAALGVAPSKMYFLWQVHGKHARRVDGSEDREQLVREQGDAVLALAGELACCVRIADCAPVLLADRDTGAVAAVHAGWRGVAADIVGATIERLRAETGSHGDLVAAIGPHISLRAFEVGEEVAQQLAAASPVGDVVSRDYGAKPHVDLRRILRGQLRRAGLGDDAIDDVAGCTVSDEQLRFSYRRGGPESGRHLAGIVPLG